MSLSFEGKAILAPMVRISTLPMRALCLDYGADYVFTPEIIDKKLVTTERVFNKRTGTFDYMDERKGLVLRVYPKEKPHLILQIGTACPDLAQRAVQRVARDISGVDVNCGCPKHFSVHGGMGAALLRNPQRLVSILERLFKESGLPVSAKIRLLPTVEDSVSLIRQILATGIHALTIHCRTPDDRPREPARHSMLKQVLAIVQPSIPIIVNGDMWTRMQAQEVVASLGASGFMMARAAQWNPSCFMKLSSDGSPYASLQQVIPKYLHYCLVYQSSFQSIKYAIMQMYQGEQARHKQARAGPENRDALGPCSDQETPDRLTMALLQKSRTVEDLIQVFDKESTIDPGLLEAYNESRLDATPESETENAY